MLKDFLGFIFSFVWEDNYWYLCCIDLVLISLSRKYLIKRVDFSLASLVIYSDYYYGTNVNSSGRKSSCLSWNLSGWNDEIVI